MLLRRVAVDDGSGVGRPRLFATPRLLVGLEAPRCDAPDYDSPMAARSLTSPLDLRPFASLLRSPRSPRTRSWDSHRLGLDGLVDDTLAEPAACARSRLLGLGPQARQPFKLPQRLAKPLATQPRDCSHASSELGNVGTAAGCKPLHGCHGSQGRSRVLLVGQVLRCQRAWRVLRLLHLLLEESRWQ